MTFDKVDTALKMVARILASQKYWLVGYSSCAAVGTAHFVAMVLEQLEERHDDGSLEQQMREVLLAVEN